MMRAVGMTPVLEVQRAYSLETVEAWKASEGPRRTTDRENRVLARPTRATLRPAGPRAYGRKASRQARQGGHDGYKESHLYMYSSTKTESKKNAPL